MSKLKIGSRVKFNKETRRIGEILGRSHTSIGRELNRNSSKRKKKEQENNVQEKYLTYDEEKRLIENCPEWLRDLVVFSLNTGLRQHEQLSVTWERVSHNEELFLFWKQSLAGLEVFR